MPVQPVELQQRCPLPPTTRWSRDARTERSLSVTAIEDERGTLRAIEGCTKLLGPWGPLQAKERRRWCCRPAPALVPSNGDMPARSRALSIHERMGRIRQRDTAPELVVRRFLSSRGIHYRVCPPTTPGRPDLANKSARWALFVHGCFWHGHPGCVLARLPKSNVSFWTKKIDDNRARDARKERELERLGYHVYTVWQCELEDSARLERLARTLRRM